MLGQIIRSQDRTFKHLPIDNNVEGAGLTYKRCRMLGREFVYVICYGKLTVVGQRDCICDLESVNEPITHYVGHTTKDPPIKRVRQHGAKSAHYLVTMFPGTTDDELYTKSYSLCPKCGGSLWYYTDTGTDREGRKWTRGHLVIPPTVN